MTMMTTSHTDVTSFLIPYPPGKTGKSTFCRKLGLNAYYAGKHWAQRKKEADELHQLTIRSLKKAGVRPKVITHPVEVRFFWDDGLDIDNHAVIGKAVVDALKGVLLPDDNPRWFRRVSHEFWDGGAIRVDILPFEERKE